MALTIWKFPLSPPIFSPSLDSRMPEGAQILHVDVQDGSPMLWALVDPTRPRVIRDLRIVPTGSPVTGEYVGTFQLERLVFHLFDLGEVT